jgi:hypothetical protein
MGTTSWLPARWKPSRPSGVGMQLHVVAVAEVRPDRAALLDEHVRRVAEPAEPRELLAHDARAQRRAASGPTCCRSQPPHSSATGHGGVTRSGLATSTSTSRARDQRGWSSTTSHADALAGQRAGDEHDLAVDASDALAAVREPVDGTSMTLMRPAVDARSAPRAVDREVECDDDPSRPAPCVAACAASAVTGRRCRSATTSA